MNFMNKFRRVFWTVCLILLLQISAQATIFIMDGQYEDAGSWRGLVDSMDFAELWIGDTATSGYGDYVSSTVQANRRIYISGSNFNDGEFFYDVGQEGWTPDIRAYFDNVNDVSVNEQSHWWGTGIPTFSNLQGCIYATGDPCTLTPGVIGINLIGENGKDVKIYDFDIAATAGIRGVDCEVKVYEISLNGAIDGTEDGNFAKNNLVYSKIQIAPRTGILTVPVNVSGSLLRLEVIGGIAGQVAIDNLRIGQSPAVFCGDIGFTYLGGDINQDCDVNIDDLALLLANWLKCTDFTGCP